MGVRFRDRLTPEGERFFRELAELKELEVRVGFQRGDAQEEDGTDMCDVAAFNELGTDHIPARPFIRQSVDDNESKINAFLKAQVKDFAKGKSAEQVLKEIGNFQKDLIQTEIEEGNFVPNAESTIRQKAKKGPGPYLPLQDTGRMKQSVNFVIQKKGSGDD